MRNAIALLITLFFLMAITLSIGIGLKQVNSAKSTIKGENFLLQTNIILDDVLTFLKKSEEIKFIKDNDEAFDIFLAQSEFIPFEAAGIKVGISIKSARSKIDLNGLLSLPILEGQPEPKELSAFKSFLSNYNVNLSYLDMLKDSVSGIDNIQYNQRTEILDEKPDMFREYIASFEQLKEINEFYTNRYYEDVLTKIDFKDLFYFRDSNSSSYCIDSYYASEMTKVMLEGVNIDDAENFVVDINQSNFSELYCSDGKSRQFLDVELEIIKDEKTANISFEYDINGEKGYNFSYEI